ncbi:MAG: trigger factor [Clostridia bacterium]|nr:trigger factor [Clostridia bacterium]
MEYSVQHLSKSKIEIAIDVPAEEWAKEVKASFEKNKFKYSVEGFRKGKVPMNIVVNRYGIGVLYEDALDEVLSKHYTDILKNDNLDVIGNPDVDIKEVSEDGMKAVITVAIRPEFELGQYKGLTFKMDSTEVTDDDINAVINRELDNRARLVEKSDDAVVENGDTVNIDYSGSVDGVKFDGGTAEKQSLVIGSGSFIPGFEEQLIGMKKGDKKDINVTFPEQYTPELAGKDAVFAITLNGIQHKELPVLDDEFVKDIDDELETVDAWKEKIKSEIAPKKIEQAGYKLENDMIETISNNTEIEIPEAMIEEELDYRVQELERDMSQYGLRFADYLAYTGMTVEQIKEEQRPQAEKNIKSRLIIEAIVKAEKIDVTPEEMNAEFDKLDEKDKNPQQMSYIANKLLVDKLFAFLRENNTVNE